MATLNISCRHYFQRTEFYAILSSILLIILLLQIGMLFLPVFHIGAFQKYSPFTNNKKTENIAQLFFI